MIYLPGNIFNNSYSSSGSELVAVTTAGLIYGYLKAKKIFIISFTTALVGSLLILFIGNVTLSWMPLYVIIAKFGISSAYLTLFIATVDVFPTLFCATAFGVVNFVATLVTILAPVIAEMKAPFPMLVYAILCLLGLVLTFAIRPKK